MDGAKEQLKGSESRGGTINGLASPLSILRSRLPTGRPQMARMGLRECCKQIEAEEVSNSRNKCHQTMCEPFKGACLVVKSPEFR